jgi:uncharacterized protein
MNSPQTATRMTFRTATLAVNIRDCACHEPAHFRDFLRRKLDPVVQTLRNALQAAERRGTSFESFRLAVTPLASLDVSWPPDGYVTAGLALDEAARELGAEFVGGFSASVEVGLNPRAEALMEALPQALRQTQRLCGFLNVASTRAGVNMHAVAKAAELLLSLGRPADQASLEAFARFAISSNASSDIPFMPLAFHGDHGPDLVLNIGLGGIEHVNARVAELPAETPLEEVCATITDVVAERARHAEEVGKQVAKETGAILGSVDVSLLPMPRGPAHSLQRLFQLIGLESLDAPGSIAVLSMLNNAIRRGAAVLEHRTGLSGTLVSIAEDSEVGEWLRRGNSISVDRLLALSTVCSMGLDMVAISLDTTADTLIGLLADEMAIGCVHRKPTAVRLILVSPERSEVVFRSNTVLGRTRPLALSNLQNRTFARRLGFLPPSLERPA